MSATPTSSRFLRCCAVAAWLLGLAVVAGCASAPGERADPVLTENVSIRQGDIKGSARDHTGVLAFKGIPFAAPPVGPLRWETPQPAAAWQGMRDATTYGNKCWASNSSGGPIATDGVSEDCLYLNVWTPAKRGSDKLPVMVWVHGGGFQIGTSSTPASDGTLLARRDVVVVTFNYRLGVFGFLARTDLDAESAGRRSGMYGMHDQVAALRWVKENIAAFGGDAGNVTVFGESAGAHAIGMLMASPLAKGLFHKAISGSGSFWESEHGPMKAYGAAQNAGLALSVKVGAPTLDALRAKPALELQQQTNWNNRTDPGRTNFAPVVDGHFLTEDPAVTFARGRQHDVPLLAGWNADEGGIFMKRALPTTSTTEYAAAASKVFGANAMPDFLRNYPGATTQEAQASARMLIGDLVISYQTWKWVQLHHATGRSPVYAYNFTFTSPLNPVAGHATELVYVWGTPPASFRFYPAGVAPNAADLAMTSTIQGYWTRFARSGDPNGPGLPAWPRYAGPGSSAMQLGDAVVAGPELGLSRFRFLDRYRIDGVLTINVNP